MMRDQTWHSSDGRFQLARTSKHPKSHQIIDFLPHMCGFPYIKLNQFGGGTLVNVQVIQIKQAVQACPDPYNCAISILQLVPYVVLWTVCWGVYRSTTHRIS